MSEALRLSGRVLMRWAWQEYSTTALLGCETDSFDSVGAQVRVAPWKHVTREMVEEALGQFRGEIMQTPPMYVARVDQHCPEVSPEG